MTRQAVQDAVRSGVRVRVDPQGDELQRIAGSLVFVNAGRALSAWTRDQALARFGGFDALYEHVFLREGV